MMPNRHNPLINISLTEGPSTHQSMAAGVRLTAMVSGTIHRNVPQNFAALAPLSASETCVRKLRSHGLDNTIPDYPGRHKAANLIKAPAELAGQRNGNTNNEPDIP